MSSKAQSVIYPSYKNGFHTLLTESEKSEKKEESCEKKINIPKGSLGRSKAFARTAAAYRS